MLYRFVRTLFAFAAVLGIPLYIVGEAPTGAPLFPAVASIFDEANELREAPIRLRDILQN